MAKKTTVERRTISIPPELSQRMAKAKDENWSAIACKAFEQRLGEIAAQKKEKEMKDVVDRLRWSLTRLEDETKLAGKDAGEKWARDDAEAVELKNLERLDDEIASGQQGSGRTWEDYLTPVGSAYSISELLGNYIRFGDHDNVNYDAPREFWESAVGSDAPIDDPRFLEGFAEGALKIWNAVKSQL